MVDCATRHLLNLRHCKDRVSGQAVWDPSSASDSTYALRELETFFVGVLLACFWLPPKHGQVLAHEIDSVSRLLLLDSGDAFRS